MIVAASVLAHGLAMALLGLTAPALREVRRVDPRAIALEMWMASPADQASHRARPAATAPTPLRPRRVADSAPAAVMAPLAISPAPARPGAIGSAAGAGGHHPAPLPGETRGEALRQALRGSPVGCGNRDTVGLTRREREACDDAFGKRSVETADITAPIDPSKRAAWDSVAARKALARRRKEGAVPPGVGDPTNNAGGTRTNGIGLLGY